MKKYLLFVVLFVVSVLCHAQAIVTVAGGNNFGTDSTHLWYPYGVFLDKSGNLYVSDQNNSRVQMFPPGSTSATDGITVAGGNGQGAATNQLQNPAGIFVDTAGNIYIADLGNNRVIEFAAGSTSASSGNVVSGGVGTGALAFQLANPSSVFVTDSGYIYVADANNNRIQKNTLSNANAVTVAGGYGQGNTAYQLYYPTGVFVDANGLIYVADYLNNRIQRFTPGDSAGVTVAGGNGQGAAANQLNSPSSVFVDKAGNIYVADTYNNRVQRFPAGSDSTTNGVTVAGGYGIGSSNIQLNQPTSVFVDSSGNVYVADYLNNRVQRWAAGATSVTTVIDSKSQRLYPNPNNGTFVLTGADNLGNEYAIYDIIGRIVGQGVIASAKQTIAIRNLTTGAYSLEIKGSGAIRFVVEK